MVSKHWNATSLNTSHDLVVCGFIFCQYWYCLLSLRNLAFQIPNMSWAVRFFKQQSGFDSSLRLNGQGLQCPLTIGTLLECVFKALTVSVCWYYSCQTLSMLRLVLFAILGWLAIGDVFRQPQAAWVSDVFSFCAHMCLLSKAPRYFRMSDSSRPVFSFAAHELRLGCRTENGWGPWQKKMWNWLDRFSLVSLIILSFNSWGLSGMRKNCDARPEVWRPFGAFL